MSEHSRQFLLQWAKRKRAEAEQLVLEAKSHEESAKEATLEAIDLHKLADELEAMAQVAKR
jgi:hypothetical protein